MKIVKTEKYFYEQNSLIEPLCKNVHDSNAYAEYFTDNLCEINHNGNQTLLSSADEILQQPPVVMNRTRKTTCSKKNRTRERKRNLTKRTSVKGNDKFKNTKRNEHSFQD